MTQPITIGGLSSNLDTKSIIDKLVQVQGNSQVLLQKRQTAQNDAISAYSSMLGNIGSLVTQVDSLAKTSSWATTSATSSVSSVTATATGSVANSLSFDVTKVAAAHTLISNGSVNSLGATVATGSTISLAKSDGTSTNINVGTGSLSEVVSAINSANAGITASAVQTSPGNYRLQIAATNTGAASSFTLSGLSGFTGGTGTDAMKTLVTGSDASITVGGSGGYTVTSSTNTFSDVAQGLSFTVSKVESGVTVSSAVDTTKVSDQVSGIVTNINNLLSSITTNTAWDASSKKGGPLLGDSTVRALQQQILSTVAGMNAPGLSVTSGGQVQFDKTTFDTAFKSDPTGTMAAYGASSSFTAASGVAASATYTNATSKTEAGTYAVNIDSTAKAEQWQVIPPGTGIVGRTVALMRGSTTVKYEVQAGEDATAAASKLNTMLATAGMGITASADSSGNLVFAASNPGSAGAFTATIDGGGTASQTVAGDDIAGTIDGVTGKGIGNILTVPTDSESGAAGLSVQVNSAATGAIGDITYKPGLAQQLSGLFTQMSDSQTGSLVQAQTTAKNQVKDLQTQIDAWTDRLDAYRSSITAKFTAMETSLSALKTQQSSLASFFNSSSSSSSS
ncbi:flagellar filament capping protein FliD [Kineosporia sp. J2-2]|uniref:Flagellar hook-associated protein 2 n=1 Tax=Kineosporia corallincola TaxID=2835133 RepID=A0ABS5TJZ5_9ACTN|nr:flagellar filament capping protein FliD [Kineosporia corallincola]MBT0771422.1 flagellar filament capping protein FliD [Kineosporia corallincola]